MPFRLLAGAVTLCLSILLSGCWVSKDLFLDETSPATPFRPGVWQSDWRNQVTIWPSQGGWYRVQQHDPSGAPVGEVRDMMLNYMPEASRPGREVFLYAVSDSSAGWIYGVIVQQRGAYYELRPECGKRTDAERAAAYGAQVKRGAGGSGCQFTDADSLREGLVAWYVSKNGALGPAWRWNRWVDRSPN